MRRLIVAAFDCPALLIVADAGATLQPLTADCECFG